MKDIQETPDSKAIITRVSNTLCDRFDEVILSLGLNRSEVIRMLMNEYIIKMVSK